MGSQMVADTSLFQSCVRKLRSLLVGPQAAPPAPAVSPAPASAPVSAPPAPLTRAQYKEVWNNLATSEDAAKIAVSGYTDEDEYRRAAEFTRNLLQACVGIRSTDTILEIGAGVGRVGSILAPLCKEWIGADVSENMLTHLRNRLAGFKNVRAVALNGYDLDNIPSESIDLVYCTVVFMHLDEWERYRYVKEGMRVLKPGGRMLVDNFSLLSNGGWEMFASLEALPPMQRPPQCSKSSTPQELQIYMQKAGFINIGQKDDHVWTVAYGWKPGAAK
jgi:SAM-dependent methyltransferase